MTTLHHKATEQLGKEICVGIYRPGDILPAEPILGERLGVSRIVVREAVKSLSAKGMLEVRRKKGTMVLDASSWSLFDPDVISWRVRTATLDESLARELMELRRIVEPAACRLAAERATDEERAMLCRALDAMQLAIDTDGDYVTPDLEFHTTILKACRNQFVRQMQNALATILQTSFEIVCKAPGGPARSQPNHAALCRAIVDGDAAAAESAALRIITHAENQLLESIAATQSARAAVDSIEFSTTAVSYP